MKLILDDGTELELTKINSKTFTVSQEEPFSFIDVLNYQISEVDNKIVTYKSLRFDEQYYSFKLVSGAKPIESPIKPNLGWGQLDQ